MPDDILDAAQKAINDAAKTGGAPGAVPTPPPASMTEKPAETSVPAMPAEPPPISPTTTANVPVATPVIPQPTVASTPAAPVVSAPAEPTVTVPPPVVPPIAAEPLDATKQQMVNELLGGAPAAPTASPAPTAPAPSVSGGGSIPPKKKSTKGVLLALVATLLLTLPIGVYFISQRDNNLADIRNKAATPAPYPTECTTENAVTDPQGTCSPGFVCHALMGDAAHGTRCEPADSLMGSCERQGREWCTNMHGFSGTCCLPGYSCHPTKPGCWGGTEPTRRPPGNPDPTPTTPIGRNTPTPTSIAPICVNIKIYKGGTQVSPSTLRPGDNVVLAVKGNLTPTKARFRINGGAFEETTTKNASDEFTLNYTVPDGVPSFVIEAEVFTNGAFH